MPHCTQQYSNYESTKKSNEQYSLSEATEFRGDIRILNDLEFPDQHVAQSNAYVVLYLIRELIYPALGYDAVVVPPKSSECEDDINAYHQRFDAQVQSERYSNRVYDLHEQLNYFLSELSPCFVP